MCAAGLASNCLPCRCTTKKSGGALQTVWSRSSWPPGQAKVSRSARIWLKYARSLARRKRPPTTRTWEICGHPETPGRASHRTKSWAIMQLLGQCPSLDPMRRTRSHRSISRVDVTGADRLGRRSEFEPRTSMCIVARLSQSDASRALSE